MVLQLVSTVSLIPHLVSTLVLQLVTTVSLVSTVSPIPRLVSPLWRGRYNGCVGGGNNRGQRVFLGRVSFSLCEKAFLEHGAAAHYMQPRSLAHEACYAPRCG